MSEIVPLEAPASAAATRAVAALAAQPRRVAVACVLGLAALGWAALGLMAAGAPLPFWQALCRIDPGRGIEGLMVAGMWLAMTLAMMLPTAGPMILTYAEIAETAVRKREPVATPLALVAGYVAVWLGVALPAAALQWALAEAGLVADNRAGRAAAAVVLLGAGVYQFSALKHACLRQCQRPFPFFFANWTAATAGVLRLGLRQGLYCLGCCWAMMLVLFCSGTMNAVWMALLGIVMTVEKMGKTARFSRAVGSILMAGGLTTLATAFW